MTGRAIPSFLYGTAWKEERTEALTRQALDAGFRAIDTANQRKHYFEAGVGAAVASFLATGRAKREDLFLQTKFTYADSQDARVPYDPRARPATQVEQSLASSLEHLGTSYVDSLLLHGPEHDRGLTEHDVEVWRTLEAAVAAGRTHLVGISNVRLEQLVELERIARTKPAFVQNRCYARSGWDREVRSYCTAHGIVYQGFSLLTANQRELRHPTMLELARRKGCTVPQLVFRFAREVGMLPLTGTSSREHLAEDLAISELELDARERRMVEQIGFV